jgi:hypothetical protein
MLGLTIVICVLVLVSAILPSTGPILIKGKFIPTRLGYALFFICLLIIVGTAVQYFLTEQNEIQKKEERVNSEEKMQKKIKEGIDSGIKVNNDFLAQAFKIQGIDLDSLKERMERISKDTTRKPLVVTTSSGPDPDLDFTIGTTCIQFIEKQNNLHHYRMFLISNEAPSKNINLNIRAVYQNTLGEFRAVPSKVIFEDSTSKMGTDVIHPANLYLNTLDSILVLFLNVKGNYTNFTNSKSYNLDTYRKFDMPTKSAGLLYGDERQVIYKLLNK